MKLRRSPLASTRRQKLRSDDLAKQPSAFAYRARRLESERNTGRQVPSEAPVSKRPKHAGFRHFWLQRVGLIILVLAALASAVNVLSLSSDPKVIPLTTTSNNQTLLSPMSVYEAAASHQLSSSIWDRNKITIDTSKLSLQMLKQFPELSSVSVTIPLLSHRPLVYIETAQPALILITDNGSFVIDTTGKALTEATSPITTRQPQLPQLTDQSGLHIQVNNQALPATDITFIQQVIAQLAAKQFTITGMTLPPVASELDVKLAGQPYFVKFNLQSNNPRGEAGTFLATIAQLHRQNVTPSQYVDVRVDGRAYYK